MNPTDLKVGISTVKPLSNDNLLIQTSSISETSTVCNTVNDNLLIQTSSISEKSTVCNTVNEKCGDEMEENETKLRNRLIFYNIPKEMNLGSLGKAIIEQNEGLNLLNCDVIPKFMFKEKRRKRHLVIEVTANTRRKLLGRKLKLGWSICTNADYIKLNRCFKCNKYNHRAQDCKSEQQTCPLCTENHTLRECTAPREDYKCINCITYNKYNRAHPIDENHTALGK